MRKGAVSAHLGEKLIIPVNMRDGAFICTGKGNSEWNYSAPHGAGRIMSRAKAKEIFYLKDFQDDMKDIYIVNDENGRPELKVENKAKDLLESKCENPIIHVSLSHEKEYATAFVVIEAR